MSVSRTVNPPCDPCRKHRMPYGPHVRRHRSIRLARFDYSVPGTYFVTICTARKEFLFGTVVEGEMKLNGYGETVVLYWCHLARRYRELQLDAFVVMPNHVHGILRITGPAHKPAAVGAIHESPLRDRRRKMLLSKIVGYFKMNTSKRINEMRGTPQHPVWQRNYYERVIRNEDELNKIREYIDTNPRRWPSDPENPEGGHD